MTRDKNTGFIGIQLTPDLIKQLDILAAETTLNRSQLIRLAIIKYLSEPRT